MYELKVNGKYYKVVFRYRDLLGGNLIDRIMSTSNMESESPSAILKNMIGLTAELLLEGLQKHHKDEFGYEQGSETERKEMILKVCDLIDDYEDENNGEKGGYTLFSDLENELEKNNFLSGMLEEGAKAAATQNATVVPTDHLKKQRKTGANK